MSSSKRVGSRLQEIESVSESGGRDAGVFQLKSGSSGSGDSVPKLKSLIGQRLAHPDQ